MTDITETDEYQNWVEACADVDFLADERRPETTAALEIADNALKALQIKIKELKGLSNE